MNTDILVAVRTVGRTLSFSAAAEELFCSQSSISKKVMSFEKELGVKIFERSGRTGVSVTPAGRRVLYWAGRVLEHRAGLVAAADRYSGARRNSLCVAGARLDTGSGGQLLLTAFCQKYPELRLKRLYLRGADYYDALLSGRADALFLYTGGPMERNPYVAQLLSDPVMDRAELCAARLYVLVSARKARSGGAEIGDFRGELFSFAALRDVGHVSFLEGQFLDFCASQERPFIPRCLENPGELSLVEQLELCAAGRIVMPMISAAPLSMPGLRAVPILGGFELKLSLVWRRDRRTESLRNFIAFLPETRRFFLPES